jgi:hypothetical protein
LLLQLIENQKEKFLHFEPVHPDRGDYHHFVTNTRISGNSDACGIFKMHIRLNFPKLLVQG